MSQAFETLAVLNNHPPENVHNNDNNDENYDSDTVDDTNYDSSTRKRKQQSIEDIALSENAATMNNNAQTQGNDESLPSPTKKTLVNTETSNNKKKRFHNDDGGVNILLDNVRTDTTNENVERQGLGILRGVIACLTGMSMNEKERLHKIIMQLGGKFTRNLDSIQNTHLIASEPVGPKYEAALSFSSKATRTKKNQHCFFIVTPSWLEMCLESKQRVNEKDHLLLERMDHDINNKNNDNNYQNENSQTNNENTQQKNDVIRTQLFSSPMKPSKNRNHVLEDDVIDNTCKQQSFEQPRKSSFSTGIASTSNNIDHFLLLLKTFTGPNLLFHNCQFYFIGFDDHNKNNIEPSLYSCITRLVRRGMGTIHWNLNNYNTNVITHVIINDKQFDRSKSEHIMKRIRLKNTCYFISPSWIETSCRSEKLMNPILFPPVLKDEEKKCVIAHQPKRQPDRPNHLIATNNNSSCSSSIFGSSNVDTNARRSTSALLFRGVVFVILYVKPSQSLQGTVVDYDTQEIEQLICTNGGQIVSSKLLDAMKNDMMKENRNSQQSISTSAVPGGSVGGDSVKKRKCYIICCSGQDKNPITMNPFIRSIEKYQLCDVEEVTPIWLLTCILEQKILSSKSLFKLFQPNNYPLRYLPTDMQQRLEQDSTLIRSNVAKDDNAIRKPMRISVTGFNGYRRTAIIQLIQTIGAIYDDSMKTNTTHLICNEPTGPKYNKAIEWQQKCNTKNRTNANATTYNNTIHIVSIEWLYHVAQYGYDGLTETTILDDAGVASSNDGKAGDSGCESRFFFECSQTEQQKTSKH